MLAKSKIISIILIIIFSVSAVTCGIVFGVVKSKPQSGAITGTETSLEGYIGNLLTSDGKVNKTTYYSLISKVGAIGSVSSTQNSANINSGTPVVFQMGTAGGNPVYWQVTYRTKDYITVMMTRPYTVEYFNYEGKTYASGIFAGATKTDYDCENGYSRSTLRQATQQIYTSMNSTNSVLSQIVVSPSAMASATGTSWQSSQANSKFSSSFNAITQGLSSQTSTTNPHGWTWDNTVYSDMFWIPSFYELYNTSTSSYSFNGGLWGLSSQSYVGFEQATFLNSSVTTSYCWLRSGSSDHSYHALQVLSSGEARGYDVSGTRGVRPAAHLSLSSIASLAKWQVSFNSNGGSSCASISVEYGGSYGTLPTPTRTGYTFAGWFKNSDLSGSAVTTNTIVTEDHTLYAKWTANTYTVTLNQQSGSGGTSSVTATYDSSMPTATVPTRAGYYFLGYYTDINGSGTQYYDENMASVRNCDLTANTTLYAKWIWVGVNVHFAGSSTSASNIVFNNDETNASVNIQPQTGHYVSEISFDNSTFYKIDSYSSYYVVDFALEFQCLASTSTNQIAFVINFIFFDYYDTHETINIYLKTTTTPYTELNKTSGGASIDGVAVSSTIGGSAEVLGDNYDSLEVGDTITVVARLKLIGYQFDGWYVDDTLLSTNMSVRLTFDDTIKGKVLVAKFSEIENSNINNSTSN